MMSSILSVGIVYSSFVEMMFANMFIVDEEKKLFWRYHQNQLITVKLGDKILPKYISKLLNLLYEPNQASIEEINLEEIDSNSPDLTIYEKLWLGKL